MNNAIEKVIDQKFIPVDGHCIPLKKWPWECFNCYPNITSYVLFGKLRYLNPDCVYFQIHTQYTRIFMMNWAWSSSPSHCYEINNEELDHCLQYFCGVKEKTINWQKEGF